MWAEAIVTLKDCEDFVRSMTPLEIPLDESGKRALLLEHPSRVGLVAGKGITIEGAALLRWTVAGVQVPISVRVARVLLLPTIEERDGRSALVFALHIERADSASLPAFVDESIVSRLNDALEQSPARLVWSFTETLDFHFKLPPTLKPIRQIDLVAKWGRVRVTKEAVALAVSFEAAGAALASGAAGIEPLAAQ